MPAEDQRLREALERLGEQTLYISRIEREREEFARSCGKLRDECSKLAKELDWARNNAPQESGLPTSPARDQNREEWLLRKELVKANQSIDALQQKIEGVRKERETRAKVEKELRKELVEALERLRTRTLERDQAQEMVRQLGKQMEALRRVAQDELLIKTASNVRTGLKNMSEDLTKALVRADLIMYENQEVNTEGGQ